MTRPSNKSAPPMGRGLAALVSALLGGAQAAAPRGDDGGGAQAVLDQPAALPQVQVMARRQGELPQSIPISIDVFAGEDLRKEDIRSVTALQNKVPGLAICCGSGQANFVFLRGVQGVQAYFAETPLLASTASTTALSGRAMYFDLDHVSVLKGPQGTLFGMSTNGGAVLFSPRRPGERFGGYVSAELGDYGRRIVDGALDVPFSERLKLRLGLQSVHVDGYVKDQSSGEAYGEDDYRNARLVLSFTPTAELANELFLNYHEAGGTRVPYIPVAAKPDGPAARSLGPRLFAAIEAQQRLGYYALVGSSMPAGMANRTSLRQAHLSNITTLRLSETLSLRNLLGYERSHAFVRSDSDGTPFRILDSNAGGAMPAGSGQLFSEELQLQGKALDGRLRFTTGGLVAQSRPGTPGRELSDLSDVFGITTYNSGSSRFRTRAVYAHASLALDAALPGLKAWSGYRYSRDQRWLKQSSGTLLGPPGGTELANPTLDLASESGNGSYTLGLSYEPRPGVLLYLNNSKGFLNGGFNTSVRSAGDAPYGPESLSNFELGMKSDFRWGEMQARVNLAAYYGNYRNAQVSVTTLVNAGTPQQALAVLTRNAAEGMVRGLEWHVQLVPDRFFDLSYFGSWMSNRYTRYPSLGAQGQPVDLADTPFVYVPRFKHGLSATAQLPLPPARGQLSLSLAWTRQSALVGTSTLHPQWYDRGPGFSRLNLGADWSQVMGRQGLDASLALTNALRNRDANGGLGTYDSLGIVGYAPAEPRMLSLRLSQGF